VFEKNVSQALENMSNSKKLNLKMTPNSGVSKEILLPNEQVSIQSIDLPQLAKFDPEKIRQIENNILKSTPEYEAIEVAPEKEFID
jgi:hypothetical protein